LGTYSPKTKPKVFLGVMLLLLSGGFVLMLLSNIAFGFTVASVLIAILFSAILWGPVLLFGLAFVTGGAINPKTHSKRLLGVWLILCSAGWVLAMLKNVDDSSLDGNARGVALIVLIFSAIFWLPAFIFGLKSATGGAISGKRGRITPLTCPQCGSRRVGENIPCSSCGSWAHLQKFCAKCGERLEPHHKFCRGCGASASTT
jgi:hypothetical protein